MSKTDPAQLEQVSILWCSPYGRGRGDRLASTLFPSLTLTAAEIFQAAA